MRPESQRLESMGAQRKPEFTLRLPDQIPNRGGAVLVWLAGVNDWDIGWHCGKRWHSRTFGKKYPVMFWVNLPPAGWIADCLLLETARAQLDAIRHAVCDAFLEKSKCQKGAISRQTFQSNSQTIRRTGDLKLLSESRTKQTRRGSQASRFRLPFESYLNVLYGSSCKIAPR